MGLAFREPWLVALLVASAVVGVVLGLRARMRSRVSAGRSWSPSATAARPFVVAVLATTALVTAIGVALVPVRVTGVVEGPPRVVDQPGPLPAIVQPPARLDVTITALDDRPVRAALPASLVVARDTALPGFRAEGWETDPQDNRIVTSTAAGDTIRFVGLYDHVDLDLIQEPGAGVVRVDVGDGAGTTLDLESSGFGVRTVRIESGRTRLAESASFGWRSHALRFAGPVERIESTTIGAIPTRSAAFLDGEGRLVGATVSTWDAARAVVRAYIDLAGVVAVALLTGLASLLVGAAIEPRGFRWTVRPQWLMRMVVGLATMLAIVGALNYLMPVNVAMFALSPLLIAGGYRLAHRSETDRAPTARVGFAMAPVVSTSVVLAATALTYVISERWAIGHLQTDVFDTFNLTSMFWERGALDASTDFGNGFRLLDYSARATVWGPFLLRPSDAVIVLRLLLLGLLTPLSASLAGRLHAGSAVQVAVALVTASGAALVALYSEGYMSREFFVLWMLIALVAIGHQLLDGRRDRASWFLLGIVLAVPLAIVPPYFILAPGVVGTFFVAIAGYGWRARLRSWRNALIGLVLCFLAFGLPNLFWVRRAGDAERYVPALNQLVRSLGVPFLGDLRFPATLMGLVPFHNQSKYWLGASSYQLGPLRWTSEWMGHPALVVACFVVGVLVIVGTGCWLARAPAGNLRNLTTFIVLVLLSYLLGMLALRLLQWEDQTYFTVMWAWSLAPVAVTCFVLLLLVLASRWRGVRKLGYGAVLALTAINLVTAGSEATLWAESATGSRARLWHLDMAAPAERLSRALESGQLELPTEEFAVAIATPSALTATDDDRVLANIVANLMEANGLTCEPCDRNPDVPILQPARSAPPGTSVLMIGDRHCDGRSAVFEDEYFAICGPVN